MRIFPFLVCSFLFLGCSLQRMAIKSAVSMLDKGAAAFYEEEDLLLAGQAMASHLKLIEILLRNDPDNSHLLVLASQGFGGYAFLFVEDESFGRARRLYRRGADYGKRSLLKKGLLPESCALSGKCSDESLDKALESASSKDVPALFWTAYSWGNWINLSRNFPEALADLPTVVRLMEKVRKIDPDYHFGGADVFLGAYYASRPRMLGGDLSKAKAHFENAFKAGKGSFLIPLVLYAATCAVAAQDRDLFRETLERVLAAPPDILPEQALANNAARRKAGLLLDRIDELF